MNIIIEGNIKRQSLIASGFVNERHFVLEGTSSDPDSFRLCSYRSSGDEFPSKTWKITRNTTVSGVSGTSCKLRGEEQVSPLGFLTALVVKQDSFQNIQLVSVYRNSLERLVILIQDTNLLPLYILTQLSNKISNPFINLLLHTARC